jgi:hypothetical protein
LKGIEFGEEFEAFLGQFVFDYGKSKFTVFIHKNNAFVYLFAIIQ